MLMDVGIRGAGAEGWRALTGAGGDSGCGGAKEDGEGAIAAEEMERAMNKKGRQELALALDFTTFFNLEDK